MPSLFQSTLNTRLLPTGDMRFVRSDCPEKLTDEEVGGGEKRIFLMY